jgi:hypothetical protein
MSIELRIRTDGGPCNADRKLCTWLRTSITTQDDRHFMLTTRYSRLPPIPGG